MTPPPDASREAFEAWARVSIPHARFFKRSDGEYEAAFERDAYAAWQAASSQMEASHREIARLREAMKRVGAIEKEIRLCAYASAGDSSRRDDVRIFAIWAGTLQRIFATLAEPQPTGAGEG